jgi:hypothetical protein
MCSIHDTLTIIPSQCTLYPHNVLLYCRGTQTEDCPTTGQLTPGQVSPRHPRRQGRPEFRGGRCGLAVHEEIVAAGVGELCCYGIHGALRHAKDTAYRAAGGHVVPTAFAAPRARRGSPLSGQQQVVAQGRATLADAWTGVSGCGRVASAMSLYAGQPRAGHGEKMSMVGRSSA